MYNGIYLSPDLRLPFSTIETMMEENSEIMLIAAIEKTLNCPGSTGVLPILNGRVCRPEDAAESFVRKFSIIMSR